MNIFLHLWTILDKLGSIFNTNNRNYLGGSRGAVGYASSMNIPGPLDTYMYLSESNVLPHVEIFSANVDKMKGSEPKQVYS